MASLESQLFEAIHIRSSLGWHIFIIEILFIGTSKGVNILVDPNGHVKFADFDMANHVTTYSCFFCHLKEVHTRWPQRQLKI